MNNDLISREALKKAIEQGEGFSWDSYGKDDLCVRKKYIDDAPTVEIPVARWDCYCEGQKVGFEKALSKRPQGEWITIDDVMSVFDDFMRGDISENDTEKFLEMLKDKIDQRGNAEQI